MTQLIDRVHTSPPRRLWRAIAPLVSPHGCPSRRSYGRHRRPLTNVSKVSNRWGTWAELDLVGGVYDGRGARHLDDDGWTSSPRFGGGDIIDPTVRSTLWGDGEVTNDEPALEGLKHAG